VTTQAYNYGLELWVTQATCDQHCTGANACSAIDVPTVTVLRLDGTPMAGPVALSKAAGCGEYSATVTGLTPGTGYQYQFTCPGASPAVFNDVAPALCTAACLGTCTAVATAGCRSQLQTRADPGACTPVVDGTITAGPTDWTAAAIAALNGVVTNWIGNTLNALRVCYDPNYLYLGIDGSITSPNAIAVYLDQDYPLATGVRFPPLMALTDTIGILDTALSASFSSWLTGFGAEWAWGTTSMPVSKAFADPPLDTAGTRGITTTTNFAWLPAAGSGDHFVCTATACEVQIPWTYLYGIGGRPAIAHLGLFVRLVNANGTAFSNQTLPQDGAGATPAAVTLALPVDVYP
jgi:hypothetical protein